MPSQGKDVFVPLILFYIFIQVPLFSAQYQYQDNYINQIDGSGDGDITPPEIRPKCKHGETWNNGELYCDEKGNWWVDIDIRHTKPTIRPPPKPHPQPRPTWPHIVIKPPRFTTKRPPRTTTTRTPRTTTTRTPRTTTTRTPRTTTTRTPRTTTKRTPRTTTKRTPRTTTTRMPRTTTIRAPHNTTTPTQSNITTGTPNTTTTRPTTTQKATPNTTTTRPTTTQKPCKPSVTKVRGGVVVCAGQTIFEDNFDSFRDNIWQIEHYIPTKAPDFPFVTFQNLPTDPTVKVENGELKILPKLQEKQPGFTNDTIFTGSINLLQGCTSSADACVKHSWGADILQPIVSGRITSKGFAFTYGTVTVRAKLPQGDWLYPEILLEPFLQKYGSLHYSSGVINIASARGNRELKSRTTDYSNKVLFGGPVMDAQCYETLLEKKKIKNGLWGDDYHKYNLLWTPENITLSVDGKQWAHVAPSPKGLRDQFSRMCSQVPRNLLGLGTKMAPFDDHFYITLGVAAGSINKFPDRVLTENGRPKPWTNPSRKALLNFWQDTDAWYATWNQPELLVDYIKVVAL